MTKSKFTAGYVAITSAVVMSVVILVIVLSVGLGSFLNRADILGRHFKERSYALAEGCVQVARLRLAGDSSYAGGETVGIDSDECRIVSVVASSSQKVISAQASYEGAFTNLKVAVQGGDFSVSSWEELKKF